ncbi:hypothetical protein PICST_28260 [Scheffersomyces stipitis CBS 6054]|uniref:Uncharacterized protein n=1 Tax=Scheffersomyces stipitis (strain ATCC 58785 / CBS 6054 / NBRC 10063 / NRRL Y-11545) TaxID=322104 RepID=A3GFI6_PICST|nr:predicted protein [Scheffersomyces stipitis CBS 6054]EAZ63355.2 hypothetical protein PICST_28260 [Scheffersomyces stipitis CBS 6054]
MIMIQSRIATRLSSIIVHHRQLTYLSDRWVKEPFELGYPNFDSTIASEKAKIHDILFGDSNRGGDESIDNLERPLSHYHSKPKDIVGQGLYALETGYKTKNHLKILWNKLDEKEKTRLTSSPNRERLYDERIRVWKGYEVVEHLKRNSDKYNWNPYPLSGLFPWEIVKDKLRNRKPVMAFEQDYYDVLIKEAFSGNKRRTAYSIFYADIKNQRRLGSRAWMTVSKLYEQLPPERREYYEEREQRRKVFIPVQKAPVGHPPFHVFFDEYIEQNSTSSRPLLGASTRWAAMTDVERQNYTPLDSKYHHTREYKERKLLLMTHIVLDYIYHVGGVEGVDGSYSWVQDMKERTVGFTYLHKMYTDDKWDM